MEIPNSSREFLAATGWLARCSPRFRSAILASATVRSFAAGQTVARGGEVEGAVFGVAAGQVAISWYLGTADSRLGYVALPGAWWGLAPVLGRPRGAESIARTETICLAVEIKTLRQILDETPGSWRDFGSLAYELATQFAIAHDDLMIRDSQLRLIAVLLRVAGWRHPDPPVVPPPPVIVTHEELAQMANLSRSPVAEILHELERLGHIRLRYRAIEVQNPDALTKMLEAS